MKDIIRILSKNPLNRTKNEIMMIASFLRNNENLMGTSPSPQYESALIEICKVAEYKFAVADEILFKKGDSSSFWCILLSGSVIIDKSLFLPNSCFGMRQKSKFRTADCIVLEDSHLIMVKFPDDPVGLNKSESKKLADPVQNSPARMKKTNSTHDSCSEDEEEDCNYPVDANDSDLFWESLLKEPSERTSEDVKVIYDQIKGLPAFTCLTTSTVMSMSSVMVAAVVRDAGQRVLHNGELMDTWSVILNGCVEITDVDGSIRELSRGDSFGVKANLSKAPQTFRGDMFTVTEDCHFVCINQEDYIQIMANEGQTQVTECGEGGRILLVYEEITNENNNDSQTRITATSNDDHPSLTQEKKASGNIRVVTKGTSEKLIDHLIHEPNQNQMDTEASITDVQSYAEDFFLTYRTFLDGPKKVASRLLYWYKTNGQFRLRVKRCVLLWVHQYFSDFEDNSDMIDFLNKFDQLLSVYGNPSERRLLNLACSTRAKVRTLEFNLTVFRPKNPSKLTSDLKVFVPFIFASNQEDSAIFLKQVDSDFDEITMEQNPWPFNREEHPLLEQRKNLEKNQYDEFRHRKPLLRVGDQVIAFNEEILTLEPGRSKYKKPTNLLQAITNYASTNSTKIDTNSPKMKTLTPQQHAIYQQGSHILQSCKIRLTLVYNPLQYQQILNKPTSNTNNKGNPPIPPQRGPQNIPIPFRKSPVQNKRSIPTSVSIPHGLGADSSQNKDTIRRDKPRINEKKHSDSSSLLNGNLSSSHPDLAMVATNLTASSNSSIISKTSFNHNEHGSMSRRNPLGGLLHAISHGNLAEDVANSESGADSAGRQKSIWMNSYSSNLSINNIYQETVQVIRVWRGLDDGREQTSKLVLVKPWTTAKEAKSLALEEFGMGDDDSESYSLYLVTVDQGPLMKASRIANSVTNLTHKIPLHSRYYLRHIRSTEIFMNDDTIKAILLESRPSLMQLDLEQLCLLITSEDHRLFKSVESTEYVNEIFNLESMVVDQKSTEQNNDSTGSISSTSNKSRTSLSSQSSASCSGYFTGTFNLTALTDLVNVEAYWAPTEICSEVNLVKRVEILKKFIKLTKYFRALRNYNAMFCILMGLHQSSVERLRLTWDRLPNKYLKIFRETSLVLDTSRNFGIYRSLLNSNNTRENNNKLSQHCVHSTRPPVLPYLPLVMKDLTFIHLGNPSKSDEGLVNFVKLRMIAKEIRNICRMSSVDFDYKTSTDLLNKSHLKEIFQTSSNSKMSSSSFTDSSGQTPQKTSRGAKAMRMMIQAAKSTLSGTNDSQHDNNGYSSRNRSHSTGNGPFNMSSVNPRKIYEQWHAHLQLKTYLNNVNIITDADQLMELSYKCEPPRNQTPSQASILPLVNRVMNNTTDSISNDDSGLESETNFNNNTKPTIPKAEDNNEDDSKSDHTTNSAPRTSFQGSLTTINSQNHLSSVVTPSHDNCQTSVRHFSDALTSQKNHSSQSLQVEHQRPKMRSNLSTLKHNTSIRESMQSLVPVATRHQYSLQDEQNQRAQINLRYNDPRALNQPRLTYSEQSSSLHKLIMNKKMINSHYPQGHAQQKPFMKQMNFQSYCMDPNTSNYCQKNNLCNFHNAPPTNNLIDQTQSLSSIQNLPKDLASLKLCKQHAQLQQQMKHPAMQSQSPRSLHSTYLQSQNSLPTSHHQQMSQNCTVSFQMPSKSFDATRQIDMNYATSKYDPMSPQFPKLKSMQNNSNSLNNIPFDQNKCRISNIDVASAPGLNRPIRPPSYDTALNMFNKRGNGQLPPNGTDKNFHPYLSEKHHQNQ